MSKISLSLILILFVFSVPVLFASSEEVQTQPIRFFHESYDTPQLQTLRNEFDFDEYVSRGKSEFEQMILLKDWVFSHVEFKHNYAVGELRNAIKILRMGRKGSTFHCSHFAAVYLQSALSMGWTARYYFLQNIKQEIHAVNEIWSNDYRKWIFIDVTWNIHVEKNRVPLSLLEMREEWLKNHGMDVVYVFGAGENEIRYTFRDFPVERSDNNAWIWWPLDEIFITYTYEMALVGRNNFFSNGAGDGEEVWDNIYVLRDELNENDDTWSLRNRTDIDDMRALYHDINRVDIHPTRVTDRHLEIRLDAFGEYNFTPNFKEFLVRIDGREWKVSQDNFRWELTRRRNVLEARVRNRFGVLGPVSELTINSP